MPSEPASDLETRIKLAVYHHFAETGRPPLPAEIATRTDTNADRVIEAYRSLFAQRLLVLDTDHTTIRMAPPFSSVPTQHRVESNGVTYFAPCAWDSLGIPAALHRPAVVHSRCEQSHEPFDLDVGVDGPPPSDWLFHSLVPAARWWPDIVYT